jgi:radical SAM protein with 4Fe4S-binding SPASM domain
MNTYLQQSKDFIKKSLARSEIINPFRTLFKEVEFETLAYCNRKCEYCPNVDWERFGDDESFFMKDEVFRALIQQLKDLGFSGQIAPHMYGEPLSDPRLTKWMAYIRKNLPDSKIKVVTNGDFLSKQKYDELIESGVNVFFISIHSKKLKKICLDMLDQLTEQEKSEHIIINDFYNDYKEDQIMFANRGGDIDLKTKEKKIPPTNCVYATYPVINTFGDLVLCCQDYHNNYIFGNIMERHLGDIWYDPSNMNLRKRIFKSKFDIQICQDCLM